MVVDMIALTREYGRYGYRRIAVKYWEAGWSGSDNRIERLRRREGLKAPQKQPEKWKAVEICPAPAPPLPPSLPSSNWTCC